jgi:hypothetical protein
LSGAAALDGAVIAAALLLSLFAATALWALVEAAEAAHLVRDALMAMSGPTAAEGVA